MRVLNLPMRALLQLPFTTPLSGRLMLISYIGRKTGKAYRQPVSYAQQDDTLLTPGGGNWKWNLRDGQPVRIRLRGRDVLAQPELIKDPDEIERLLAVMAAANPTVSAFCRHPKGPKASWTRSSRDRGVTVSGSCAGISERKQRHDHRHRRRSPHDAGPGLHAAILTVLVGLDRHETNACLNGRLHTMWIIEVDMNVLNDKVALVTGSSRAWRSDRQLFARKVQRWWYGRMQRVVLRAGGDRTLWWKGNNVAADITKFVRLKRCAIRSNRHSDRWISWSRTQGIT
jgi:hypothetical protein